MHLVKKDKGIMEYLFPMLLIGFVVLIILTLFNLKLVKSTMYAVEDSLVMACLASAVIDTNRYGIDETIMIPDANYAYVCFVESLSASLHLDNSLTPLNKSIIKSSITIDEYIIYNVTETRITEIVVDKFGIVSSRDVNGVSPEMSAPNGKPIESTSVYAKITFDVRNVVNSETARVSKSQLVDIKQTYSLKD